MPLNKYKHLLFYYSLFMIGLFVSGCHYNKKNNSGQQEEKRPERVIPAYYKYFQGTVGNKKAIIQLIKYSDRYEGIFINDSIGRPLPLSGERDSSGRLVLVSYNHYNPVDTFRGKFPQPGVFQGACSDTAGERASFTFQEIYPTGTSHWSVYTLTDSLALDTSKHDSPKARTQFMLLWPKEKDLTKTQYTLLRDSIVMNYYKIDTILTNPAHVLQSAEDTFFIQYKQFGARLKNAGEGPMAATFNWQSDVSMKLLWNADSIVSLAFQSYEYTGGAHGLSNTSLMVFDVSRQKVLTMSDIFNPGYEKTLQEVLEKHLRTEYDIPAGASLNGRKGILFDKHLALTKNFYLTGKGIGFIYNPYEVAPYVVGQIELYVPFSEIQSILKPEVFNR